MKERKSGMGRKKQKSRFLSARPDIRPESGRTKIIRRDAPLGMTGRAREGSRSEVGGSVRRPICPVVAPPLNSVVGSLQVKKCCPAKGARAALVAGRLLLGLRYRMAGEILADADGDLL